MKTEVREIWSCVQPSVCLHVWICPVWERGEVAACFYSLTNLHTPSFSLSFSLLFYFLFYWLYLPAAHANKTTWWALPDRPGCVTTTAASGGHCSSVPEPPTPALLLTAFRPAVTRPLVDLSCPAHLLLVLNKSPWLSQPNPIKLITKE